MIETAPILAVLVALTPSRFDLDESIADRTARLAPVAEAIASAARTRFEAAALIALGRHESHFARYVLEGRCLDGPRGEQCDRDPRTGLPRARGAWQLWRVACPAAYEHPAGSVESLRLEASCAVHRLRGARRRCSTRVDDELAGMFSGYRSVSCTWAPARERVVTTRAVLALLARSDPSLSPAADRCRGSSSDGCGGVL